MVDFAPLAKRARAMRELREYAESLNDPVKGHEALQQAAHALLQEWRKRFDIPNTKYFEVYWPNGDRTHFSHAPWPESVGTKDCQAVPLNRVEFLSRQGIVNYEEDSL